MGSSDEPAPFLQNVHARRHERLNGRWHFLMDPYEHGYWTYQGERQREEAYFNDRKPTCGTDRIEYDFDAADTLEVPGDWNSQRDDLLWYEGSIWYRQRFDFRVVPGERVFLYFAAVNYHARVFLNGEELGSHAGGFTPFQFEVTARLRDTDNSLVLLVNNRRRRDGVPALNTDWWNYGGPTRDVLLVRTPETFIRDYFLQLNDAGRLSGYVRLDGTRLRQRIRVAIREARLELVTETDSRGFAAIELPANVRLWSPQRPKLYDVLLTSENDEIRDQIGFRRVQTRGHELLLNGEPVFLRSVALHEQAPLRPARAHSLADARTLLGWACELGANCVRLAHYPHNERIVRLADALGLLVWAEIPVYWNMQWQNPDTLASARDQLSELIARDKNRAAVIIWSLGNETPVGEARNEFMRELIRTARHLDSTRLVSAAVERRYVNPTTLRIDDPLGQELDVIGCNEYIGWYDGLPEKAAAMQWQCAYEKPVFMSEFGADALQGYHGDELTRWTEEYQLNVYEHQLAMLERIPFLCGISPWILMDFRSPRRPLRGILDYYNRKGLLSERGIRKKAFACVRDHYASKMAAAGVIRCSMPPWHDWTAVDRATLVFVFRGAEVLLIQKLRGLGAGKINGPGGRLEPGETAFECATREVQEELCVTPKNLALVGELRFQFLDGHSIHGFVFTADDCEGEPLPTDEAIPQWTNRSAIPYDEMWADDRLWLPYVLEGKRFRGRFLFAGDYMLEHEVVVESSVAELGLSCP